MNFPHSEKWDLVESSSTENGVESRDERVLPFLQPVQRCYWH